jgi:hypothetical protein
MAVPESLDYPKQTTDSDSLNEHSATLDTALRLCFSPECTKQIAEAESIAGRAFDHLPVVTSWSPTTKIRNRLFSNGFVNQSFFSVLPSRNSPRWLLPRMDSFRASTGFELYTPISRNARVLKALVERARRFGWTGWNSNSLLIASKDVIPIESLAREITSKNRLRFALSIGTPGAFQKLTVQVMAEDGNLLGFMKMPLRPNALNRLKNEADTVNMLQTVPALRKHLPRLLFSGEWFGRYIIFQSAVEGQLGPTEFSPIQDEFLQTLHDCQVRLVPGSKLVENCAERWRASSWRFGTRWQNLAREALREASSDLQFHRVPCGVIHGDFAPWNTRVHFGELRVFDWESSVLTAPGAWDRFHFITQTECLLGGSDDDKASHAFKRSRRGLYLLYLLETAALFKDEGAKPKVIDHRERLLSKYIGER